MKKVLFVRHARADRELTFLSDIERPLTGSGFKDAKNVSSEVAKRGFVPDLIITSPAVRAYSTALIFCHTWGLDLSRIQLEPHLYNTSPNAYLTALSGLVENHSRIMLTGHNDLISDAVKLLVRTKFNSMKTTGTALVSAEGYTWEGFFKGQANLEFYLDPGSI